MILCRWFCIEALFFWFKNLTYLLRKIQIIIIKNICYETIDGHLEDHARNFYQAIVNKTSE